jgi:hypothetical protein
MIEDLSRALKQFVEPSLWDTVLCDWDWRRFTQAMGISVKELV